MQLIVCTFGATSQAAVAKQALQTLGKHLNSLHLGNIAVLRKNKDGQFSFKETEEETALTQGSTIGLLAGMILTALFGPVALATGAAVGTIAGGLPFIVKDLGFPDAELERLGADLKAGSSALVTLVHRDEVALVIAELERHGGRCIQQSLDPELVQKLCAVDKDTNA